MVRYLLPLTAGMVAANSEDVLARAAEITTSTKPNFPRRLSASLVLVEGSVENVLKRAAMSIRLSSGISTVRRSKSMINPKMMERRVGRTTFAGCSGTPRFWNNWEMRREPFHVSSKSLPMPAKSSNKWPNPTSAPASLAIFPSAHWRALAKASNVAGLELQPNYIARSMKYSIVPSGSSNEKPASHQS